VAPRAKRQGAATRPKQRKRGASAIRTRKIDLRNKRKTKEALGPIVGIGGSAGGFEAAMELLRHLPPSTGMAFVVVQHLDPHHASRLPKLLGKVTAMPVIDLAEPTTPRPNTVYVQPANECVIVKNGALKLIRRTQQFNLAIDHFFESLAEERGSRAIRVILSGSGTDGTAGLRAIKAAGGITELRPNIDILDLENILRDVTETLNTRERKVRDVEGRDCWLRVRPYRTTDNKIDGAVITLVDLEGKKESYADKASNRAKQGPQRK
jgi:CheB methylesterase/PAS domain